MIEVTNAQRAEWARQAIAVFAQSTGLDRSGEESDTILKDLLTDLRHWCDEQGVDFDTISELSRGMYEEEVAIERSGEGE